MNAALTAKAKRPTSGAFLFIAIPPLKNQTTQQNAKTQPKFTGLINFHVSEQSFSVYEQKSDIVLAIEAARDTIARLTRAARWISSLAGIARFQDEQPLQMSGIRSSARKSEVALMSRLTVAFRPEVVRSCEIVSTFAAGSA